MTVRIDSQQKAMFDEDLRAKAIQTIREIREDAKNRPELTLEEINAEINAVREARRQTV